MTELLIVGRGLAASCLMHACYQREIPFKVIGLPELSNSSRVAAGIWNPVVFKRLTSSWNARVFVPALLRFYRDAEARMAMSFLTERQIVKPFSEEQEKKLWMRRAELELETFLDPCIYQHDASLSGFHTPMGYGLVQQAGNLHMETFLDGTSHFFSEHILHERFEHAELNIAANELSYRGLRARRLVFCEGYLLRNNPYFNWLPLKPAKGEVLNVEADFVGLNTRIFNKNGFILPLGANRYKVGATYAWTGLTDEPTTGALAELETKVKAMTGLPYKIVEHQAGVRPSSIDRRPLLGRHPKHEPLFVFNGLGTKGVMLAPWFAEKFVNFFLKEEPLAPEANIERFYHLYDQNV